MLEECQGILVRRSRWSESSLLATWLTDRFGTLKTSARGALRAKSPFTARLDLFLRARISLSFSSTSDLHALREVEVQEAFSNSSYPSLAAASYFCELAASVTPEMQPAPGIYQLLAKALAYLQSRPPGLLLIERFEAELARQLGVGPVSAEQSAIQAIASLCGSIPQTRRLLLNALKNRTPLAPGSSNQAFHCNS